MIKKIIALVIVSALSGCSTINTLVESYLMKYDTNEYNLITDIRTTAKLSKTSCADNEQSIKNAQLLSNKSVNFVNYVEYLPHNNKVKASSIELNQMIQGLNDRYKKADKVSITFCNIKFESIEHNAETMQKIIGAKPR
jgi:hypothetical protein